jgi:hypothetical protein
MDTERRQAAASAIRAVLAGQADVAAVANAFGFPLDTPRERVVSMLLDIASPPAEVVDLASRRAGRGTAAKPTPPPPAGPQSPAGGGLSPAERKARQEADRQRLNSQVLRSYRLKGPDPK